MQDKHKILIVEDDESVREMLVLLLNTAGYENVVTACDGDEALEKALKENPDLVLLDLMLPGTDGLTVCSLLRINEKTRKIPIIMLTAKDTERDIVHGLDLGANDYITKPFSRHVLLARIRTQLRNVEERLEDDVCQYGPIKLDAAHHQATVNDEPISLTATEYALLQLFIKHPGRVFTRAQLTRMTKGDDWPSNERAIDVHLVFLRRKLGDAGNLMETIRGVGYRLKEDEAI